jgi:hypothetical protein
MAISGKMKTKSTNETIIQEESSRIQPFSLTKTAGIFYLMICGILASILILFVEKLLFLINK